MVIAAKNAPDSRTSSTSSGADVARVGAARPAAGDDLGDPPGPRRHDHHPVGQHHGLRDRVGHEQHRGAGLQRDPQQLGLHPLAGHLVQRAERLVHQQQLRARRQRPGDGHPLLHAAGELAGPGLRELGQPDQLQQLGRARPALRLGHPVHVQRQLDVLRDACATRADRPAGTRCRSPGPAGPGAGSCRPPGPCRRWAAPGRRPPAAASTCRSRTGRSARRTRPRPMVSSMPSSACTASKRLSTPLSSTASGSAVTASRSPGNGAARGRAARPRPPRPGRAPRRRGSRCTSATGRRWPTARTR